MYEPHLNHNRKAETELPSQPGAIFDELVELFAKSFCASQDTASTAFLKNLRIKRASPVLVATMEELVERIALSQIKQM